MTEEDSRLAIVKAIADLMAAGIPVPAELHLVVRVLDKSEPAATSFNGTGHTGAVR